MRTEAKSASATITVRVPLSIRKRGGRKIVLAPDGTHQAPQTLRYQQVDDALVKALARAFRWREMLESGEYAALCFIPVGGAEGGEPHFLHGMLQEFTVE